MKARLDQHDVEYLAEGPASRGAAEVLLATDTDLMVGTTWAAAGYTVAVWLTPTENDTLRDGLAELVRAAVRGAGLSVPANWPVTAYHHLVGTDAASGRGETD